MIAKQTMRTVKEVLPPTDENLQAAFKRMMETTARRAAGVKPEPVRRNYSVQCVTSSMILDQADRWKLQYATPAWLREGMAKWAKELAEVINSQSGFMVRRYWLVVVDEVFLVAKRWPGLADLHEAAMAVAKREGQAG